jgi:peptidoglycan/xylan/chitin deacetylase (PgdA/CDA1 family)
MNFRSQTRAWLIRGAVLAGMDTLAFRLQSANRSRWGLVVAMHETPISLQSHLRQQLNFASKYFTITSLEGLAGLWQQPAERDVDSKPLLLFTFDDGRESNYTVAAPLLESFGGRGVFFVVPAFAECASIDEALSFYRTRINPNLNPGDETSEDWKPMNARQIADLAVRGHAIGNHTLTHARLIGLTREELEREVGESARKIASWTTKPVDAFAWTFGWDAIDRNAWHVIRRYHQFCFSPCAGPIDRRFDNPSLLWRREIEARYSTPEVRFSYSGLVDLWWRARRKRLCTVLGADTTRKNE